MSAANVETVRTLLDCFTRGERGGPFEHYAESVEFDASHFPDGRVYRGHDGIRAFFRSFFTVFTDYELTVEAIFDAGDEVVVLAREAGRGRESGAAFEQIYAQIYTLRDGKVVRWRVRSSSGR